MNAELINRLTHRWNAPNGRPLSGSLYSSEKDDTSREPPSDCMCAQGWVLYETGMTREELQHIRQSDADRGVAEKLGISLAHSILLRQINDSRPDSPSAVLTSPESILGPEAPAILAFWHHLDKVTENEWATTADAAWDAAWDAARDAAGDAAWGAARITVGDAAWDAAWGAVLDAARITVGDAARDAAGDAAWGAARITVGDAAWGAAWGAAVGATFEIQGAAVMKDKGIPFFFLPLFGFNSPEDIPAGSGVSRLEFPKSQPIRSGIHET